MPLRSKQAANEVDSQPPKPPKKPVWRGPEVDGVTQSLLSRFLCCRERFRLLVVEGLKPAETFNHKIHFGHMWHICEESLARQENSGKGTAIHLWPAYLKDYCQGLCQQYRNQQEQIDHWYNVVKVTFPLYIEYWAKHPDTVERTPLMQEQVFDVPHSLPSGRTVRLKGKFDSVDIIGKGKGAGIYLQENKTKGDIREELIKRQLTFDLQTMLYLTALVQDTGIEALEEAKMDLVKQGTPFERSSRAVKGVRYNVIRRPLSGGTGTIRRHKPTKSNPAGESKADYYARLAGIISEAPQDFFMRWRSEVLPVDVQNFRRRCLDPLLEQLWDWWEFVTSGDPWRESDERASRCPGDPPENYGIHWQHPFGVFNVLDEGGASDLDEYLLTGSTVGLTRVDELFPELTPNP